ncbi:MAG: AbrB family transcriptional regulator [Parvularculaceae bacterium]|nr:AbrB family transcriptional regulator [Parvularculaceae bacterium]
MGSALSQASLVPKSSTAKGVSTSPLKIRKIGNSHGVVFPKEMLARLRASEGDEIAVTETETGLHLHRKDDEFEEHMKRVEEIMARYPNTLRALAK